MTLAILARIVPAEAFGVMGVALPLAVLPRMAATLGFGAAAIQDAHGEPDLISALFWRVVAWSLVAAVVTALAGSLFARLYSLPELSLVVPVLAVATILNALGVVPLALLERRLKLQLASLVRLAAQTTAAVVAVTAALQGYGVWSLVMQHVVELAILAPAAWIGSRWWPRLRFTLSHETRSFGGYFSLSILLFYLAQNIDKLLLAAWLGSSTTGQALLGMYSQAYNLALRPVYFVTTPLSTVMLPTLSRLQHDAVATDRYIQRFYALTALMLLPAGVGLWIVSHDVMHVLAPKWMPMAGVFLAVLSPVILAQGFINIAGSVLAAARRTDVLCFAALVQLVLLAQAVWGGASFAASDYKFTAESFDADTAQYHTVLGAAYGVSLVTTIILLVPYIAIVFWVAGVPLARFFSALRVAWPAAMIMGLATYLFRQWLESAGLAPTPRLLACVLLGAAIYAAFTYPQWRAMAAARD